MHNLLGAGGTVAIAAAAGLGGVGKTELARQYVDRYRHLYPAGIWWLDRSDRVGDVLIGAQLRGWGEPPDQVTTDPQRMKWFYDRWLSQLPHGDRLLVWDDGENFGTIKPLLPVDVRFKVLILIG